MNMMATLEQLQWSTGCVLISLSGRSGTNSIHSILTNTHRFHTVYDHILETATDVMNEPHSIQLDDDIDSCDIKDTCVCVGSDHSVWRQLDAIPVQGMFIKELKSWCGKHCRLFDYRGTTVVLQDRRSLHDQTFSHVIAEAQQQWLYNGSHAPVLLTQTAVQNSALGLVRKKLEFCNLLHNSEHKFFYEDHIDEIVDCGTHKKNTHYSNSVINWDAAQQWYWQTVEQYNLVGAMRNTGYATVYSLTHNQ